MGHETKENVDVLRSVQDEIELRVRERTAALRSSEERYRRIVENASEGVWATDAHGVTTFVNARMAAMLRGSASELVGARAEHFLVDASMTPWREHLRGAEERSDVKLRRRDGSVLSASFAASSVYDVHGRFSGRVAIVSDVSDRRRAEEAETRFAALVESSNDAICSMTLDGVVTSWNRSAERLFGLTEADVTGRQIPFLVDPSRLAEVQGVVTRATRETRGAQIEVTCRRKDGSPVEISMTSHVFTTAAGKVEISLFMRDVTERKRTAEALRRAEDQLRQSQKMEAIGRLAGGVAHDFNNVLSVILSYADMMVADIHPSEPMREDAEEIRKAARRAAELTRQLLAFSRQQVIEPRVIDLNEAIKDMDRMLHMVVGEDVQMVTMLAHALGRVSVDPSNIEQVIMNLVVNARDAMPRGGELEIQTADVILDESHAHDLGLPSGAYVMLSVSDTGVGMDAATQARLFEPFFTTKPKGKGTGLGLPTVFGIVKQSGGSISVHSEEGLGTTFQVYLPRVEAAGQAARRTNAPRTLRGTETILVVEDDDQVRLVARGILQRHGYRVIEARSAGEALLTIEKPYPRIDLLLTDVVMPQMNGPELARRVTRSLPDVKVLFMSGYTDDAILRHGVQEASVAFLHKPFMPETLLTKVREVLLDAPIAVAS